MKRIKNIIGICLTTIVLLAPGLQASAIPTQKKTISETVDAAPLDVFINQVDAFLKKNVKSGLVNYASIKSTQSATLASLVKQVAEMPLAGLSAIQKKAFYLNAYNIIVIHGIVKNMPTDSPLSTAGFFDKLQYNIAGEKITLNDIENKKVRPVYKDARIHFALVCAAKGCPKIQPYAYKVNTLDQQLDKVTKEAINNPSFIKMSKNGKTVQVSQIFEWYIVDFGNSKGGILKFLNKYKTTAFAANSKIGYYPYDWKLNKQ